MPLTGKELESWLARSIWKQLPDFLDMPDKAVAGRLCKTDLLALRQLARADGHTATQISMSTLAAFQRLHQHGIIARRVLGATVIYEITPLAVEILKMNASFRSVTTKEGEHA